MTNSVDGYAGAVTPSHSEPLDKKFLANSGFASLQLFLDPNETYTYYYQDGSQTTISIRYCETKRVLEGAADFCQSIPHCNHLWDFASWSIVRNGDIEQAPVLCDTIAQKNVELSDEQFKNTIRKTIQAVLPQTKTPLLTLTSPHWGRLIAMGIFIKAWPSLSEELRKKCDQLFALLIHFQPKENTSLPEIIQSDDDGWCAIQNSSDLDRQDANIVFSFLIYELSPHFNEGGTGQWLYNSVFGPLTGYSI